MDEPPSLSMGAEQGGGGGGAAGGPLWLVGGSAEGRGGGGLGLTLSAPLSLSGRGRMTCDLEDPDMLPPGLRYTPIP
jgi:hypothetical protein